MTDAPHPNDEVRQKLANLDVPKLIVATPGGTKITTTHLVDKTIDEIMAIVQAETAAAEVRGAVRELQLMARVSPLPYRDPIEKEYQDYRLKRLATLTGEEKK